MVAITPARFCSVGNPPFQMRLHVARSVNPGQVSMAIGKIVGSTVMLSVPTPIAPESFFHSPSATVPVVSDAPAGPALEALVTPTRAELESASASFTGADRERSYQYTRPSLEVTMATALVSIEPAAGCKRRRGVAEVAAVAEQSLGTI